MSIRLRLVASSLGVALACSAGPNLALAQSGSTTHSPGAGAAQSASDTPPDKQSAAQRSAADERQLLGAPSTSHKAYGLGDASPDGQENALMNEERMRAARPSDMLGNTTGAQDGGAGSPVRRKKTSATKTDPNTALSAPALRPVYSSPYNSANSGGPQPYRSPW